MSKLGFSRRQFLKTSALALPFTALSASRVLGANDRVRLAIIGCGGRGRSHLKQILSLPQCELVALCDPDTAQMENSLRHGKKQGSDMSGVKQFTDYRKLLEMSDLDGVTIASQNHWHVLHAIDSMRAGKAVYIEKPVSHSIWEGRQLLAAAKKHNAIIAAGFQNRSDSGPIDGIQYVQEGHIGAIESVHICTFKNRSSIGRRETPLDLPSTVDYNLWLGPAEDIPLYRPKFHYDWHWSWNTGNGDIGNQTPHEIDLACWVLGDGPLPKVMRSFGNRFAWNDAGETPNMQTAFYEQAGVPVTIEVNDIHLSPDRNVPGVRDQIRTGIIVKCEGGIVRGGRGGMSGYELDGKTRSMKFPGNGGGSHMLNYVEAIQKGHSRDCRSQIEVAERSSAIAHLTNLSYRAGSEASSKRLDKVIGGNKTLETIVEDQAVQLKAWGIDDPRYVMGVNVKVNPVASAVLSDDLKPEWLRSPGRGDFVVPEYVSA